jgi:hypothetical protein
VDAVLAIALAKEPKDRFETATDFALALGDAIQGEIAEEVRRRALVVLTYAPWGATA